YQARGMGVEPWVDFLGLRPGQPWADAIRDALQQSIGMLIFVSPSSMRSQYVLQELAVAAQNPDRLIIPVILQPTPDLPPAISELFWIDLSKTPLKSITKSSPSVRQAAQKIVEATKAHLPSAAAAPPVAPPAIPALAETIAQETRSQAPAPETAGKPPDSVFIV